MDKLVSARPHSSNTETKTQQEVKTLFGLNTDVLTVIRWTTLCVWGQDIVLCFSTQRSYSDNGQRLWGGWEGGGDMRGRQKRETGWGVLWTFLLWACLDCWLGDGIEDAAVLPRVVPVADALHLITAGLQERERWKIKCNDGEWGQTRESSPALHKRKPQRETGSSGELGTTPHHPNLVQPALDQTETVREGVCPLMGGITCITCQVHFHDAHNV